MVGVGEMIASAVVKQITSRLIKIAGDEISLQWKFKGEVDKMAEQMKYLVALMHDADDKVRRGGRHREMVGLWLVKLKSVSYDLEDLLDDLETKNNEAKLKLFFSRTNQAYQWITRPHNLEKVGKRIEEIKNEGKTFNLDPQARVEQSRKKETISAISDGGTSTGMQGRSAEKEKIINLILQSRANERMSIIPIVGLGGIGKTTLARSVFADKRVNIFDIQAWVHVSDKFDLHKIVRTIFRSIDTNINLDNNDLECLHNILRGKLAGKRYLIVLDDLWEEDGDNLEELKQMLQHGSDGSRIIVTTRKQSVVKTMSTGDLSHQRVILPVHESVQINLGVLPTDDCWELMKIRAFGPDDDQIPLKQIGYEIASKCGGIPLVANAFGKVMSENKSIEAWQGIKVRMLDLGLRGEHQKDTLESLKLSYYFMKLEFKICFAYLAAFPKGFVIDTNHLIQQWKALGYIYSEHDGKGCIRYLLGMSFLQISGSPSVSLSPVHASSSQQLTMHDLVHDLASVIIGEEFFLLDANATGPRTWEKTIHYRHAELIHYQNQSNVFEHLPRKLRSLHVRDTHKWQLPPKAFSRSKYMRVLDLACSVGKLSEGQSISTNISLPCSVKQMKLLRAETFKCPDLVAELHRPLDCQVRQWISRNVMFVTTFGILSAALLRILWSVYKRRALSKRAEQIYEQVCEILEDNAINAKIGNSECEPWVVTSWLRDHLLVTRERRNALLWKKVEELILEDSRIDQYPKVLKGESKVVLEWQAGGSLSGKKKMQGTAAAKTRRSSSVGAIKLAEEICGSSSSSITDKEQVSARKEGTNANFM